MPTAAFLACVLSLSLKGAPGALAGAILRGGALAAGAAAATLLGGWLLARRRRR